MRRRSVTITEAGEILGLTRSAAYRAAKAGDIRTIAIGSRYLVPVAWLEEILGEVISLDGNDAALGEERRRSSNGDVPTSQEGVHRA